MPEVRQLIASGNSAAVRQRIAELSVDGHFGDRGLDETETLIAEQFRRFADEHAEAAHQWHLADALIPLEVVQSLAELGVFSLTIPEGEYETLNGMLMQIMGKVPSTGEKVTVADWLLEIVDMDGLRVDKVLAMQMTADAVRDEEDDDG